MSRYGTKVLAIHAVVRTWVSHPFSSSHTSCVTRELYNVLYRSLLCTQITEKLVDAARSWGLSQDRAEDTRFLVPARLTYIAYRKRRRPYGLAFSFLVLFLKKARSRHKIRHLFSRQELLDGNSLLTCTWIFFPHHIVDKPILSMETGSRRKSRLWCAPQRLSFLFYTQGKKKEEYLQRKILRNHKIRTVSSFCARNDPYLCLKVIMPCVRS